MQDPSLSPEPVYSEAVDSLVVVTSCNLASSSEDDKENIYAEPFYRYGTLPRAKSKDIGKMLERLSSAEGQQTTVDSSIRAKSFGTFPRRSEQGEQRRIWLDLARDLANENPYGTLPRARMDKKKKREELPALRESHSLELETEPPEEEEEEEAAAGGKKGQEIAPPEEDVLVEEAVDGTAALLSQGAIPKSGTTPNKAGTFTRKEFKEFRRASKRFSKYGTLPRAKSR